MEGGRGSSPDSAALSASGVLWVIWYPSIIITLCASIIGWRSAGGCRCCCCLSWPSRSWRPELTACCRPSWSFR
jgi:hypothetical protein